MEFLLMLIKLLDPKYFCLHVIFFCFFLFKDTWRLKYPKRERRWSLDNKVMWTLRRVTIEISIFL